MCTYSAGKMNAFSRASSYPQQPRCQIHFLNWVTTAAVMAIFEYFFYTLLFSKTSFSAAPVLYPTPLDTPDTTTVPPGFLQKPLTVVLTQTPVLGLIVSPQFRRHRVRSSKQVPLSSASIPGLTIQGGDQPPVSGGFFFHDFPLLSCDILFLIVRSSSFPGSGQIKRLGEGLAWRGISRV